MGLITSKIVFDLNILKEGSVIKYKYTTPINKEFINAIVVKSSETELEVVQFDKSVKDKIFKNKLSLQSYINNRLIIKVIE